MVLGDGEAFFKNRVDLVYSYPTESRFPSGTILDGELVWCSDRNMGFFLVFDALVMGGKRVWNLAFAERVLELGNCLVSDEALPPAQFAQGLHRQREPSKDAIVRVVLKRHFAVGELAVHKTCSFPQDGYIFTPTMMPHVFHLLVRKWQPRHQRGCNIRGEYDLVFECVLSSSNTWRPVAIRWDKTAGNAAAVDGRVRGALKNSLLVEGPTRLDFKGVATDPPAFQAARRCVMSRAQCVQAVEQGLAERTRDGPTGLEIFNRRKGAADLPCRGVVFDGDRLVAAASAFESFAEEGGGPRGTRRAFDCWRRLGQPEGGEPEGGGTQWANASLKIDGTLLVAFLLEGALRVSTRRRMDSEQALWAREWLAAYGAPGRFREGLTYAFEAV